MGCLDCWCCKSNPAPTSHITPHTTALLPHPSPPLDQARRASFRAAERRQRIQLAALKGAKVLKRRMLLRWQEGMRVQAGERARDTRQQRLWSKVQAWLPGDLDAM